MSDPGHILAIDQGTHASRALLIDREGGIRFSATTGVALQRIETERVEQDAREIVVSVRKVVDEALAYAVREGLAIRCAALASQRSTVVAWDAATGDPLHPALSWQDTRAKPQLQRFAETAGRVDEITGLRLSPHYGVSKLCWLVDEVDAVRHAAQEGRLRLGPLAGYILFQLLEGSPHCCDVVNAGRTLLVDLASGDWDTGLLRASGLERDWLPRCLPVVADYGVLRDSGIPLVAVSGDQNAALCANGEPATDALRINAGTGAFVACPLAGETRRNAPLLTSVLWSRKGETHYLLEGTVNGAGAALEWGRQSAALPPAEAVLGRWPECSDGPPLFLNTVGGLGSPWWRTGIEPRWLDKNDGVSDACRVAGIAESILFLINANVELMRARLPGVRRIELSGGLAAADGWCQRLANLTGLEVVRRSRGEATARGIAWLAAGRPPAWQAGDAERLTPDHDAALQRRYTRFIQALEKVIAHAASE